MAVSHISNTGHKTVTFNPVRHMELPQNYAPEWYVGNLVYQGGSPILKKSSLTGGGFLPAKQLAGKQQPCWQPRTIHLGSLTGGGAVPSRTPFLTALANGTRSTSQF